MRPEPKPPRRVWIVRRFGSQMWSSNIYASETAAIRACLELGGNGYVMGPYKADWTPTQRHTEEP